MAGVDRRDCLGGDVRAGNDEAAGDMRRLGRCAFVEGVSGLGVAFVPQGAAQAVTERCFESVDVDQFGRGRLRADLGGRSHAVTTVCVVSTAEGSEWVAASAPAPRAGRGSPPHVRPSRHMPP